MTVAPTEHPHPRDGEERVRQALEDGVIARERDPHGQAGWSIADLQRDLGCSHTRATSYVRAGGANLRAGQIPLLRPRIRSAVLAALGLPTPAQRTVEAHVRRLSAAVGRINDKLDRALGNDGRVDDGEGGELRDETRALIDDAMALIAGLGNGAGGSR